MPPASSVTPPDTESARSAARQQTQQQQSSRIAFFVAGFGMAAWAPLVPLAKARTGADDAMLGWLLLCLGAGSIAAMPAAGALASRFGCRRVMLASTVLICLTLPLLGVFSTLPLLGLALAVFGMGIGSLDCAMNIQAVVVERASGRTMMSGFHGLFSVGGMAGAGGVSALLGLGASPPVAMLAVVVLIIAAMLKAAPHLLNYSNRRAGPLFALPRGIVLLLSALCFMVFLTEGAMLDWSAVFLSDVHGRSPAQAGWGYAAFALTMTLGRLTGDPVVRRFGSMRIVLLGGLCASAGLLLATLAPHWLGTLAGFALVGTGCANIVPVMYSMIGRQTAMPENLAVPAMTTLGYAGILMGPALIGAMAGISSLPAAFMAVSALLLLVAASSAWLRRLA